MKEGRGKDSGIGLNGDRCRAGRARGVRSFALSEPFSAKRMLGAQLEVTRSETSTTGNGGAMAMSRNRRNRR